MAIEIECALEGFSALKLHNNKSQKIEHDCISELYISDDLKTMRVVLREGVSYADNRENIEEFLDGIYSNMLCYPVIYAKMPSRRLTCISGEGWTHMNDRIGLEDYVQITVGRDAEKFYNDILKNKNNLQGQHEQYEKIFGIMDNPNRIIVFLALYDLLIVLASKGRERAEQRYLHDYLGKNRGRYQGITFEKNEAGKSEDTLSRLRNKIAHFEQRSDYVGYIDMEKEITPEIIRLQLRIANDILCEEPEKAGE